MNTSCEMWGRKRGYESSHDHSSKFCRLTIEATRERYTLKQYFDMASNMPDLMSGKLIEQSGALESSPLISEQTSMTFIMCATV